MKDKTYNGWTNYATWRVNLEMFDSVNLRNHFDVIPDQTVVAKWARECADELVDISVQDSDTVHGWARAFLDDVDWYEISCNLIQNASEVDA